MSTDLRVTLPSGYEGKDLLLKMYSQTESDKKQTFRSFKITVLSNDIYIGTKQFNLSILFEILKQHGMSNVTPVKINLGTMNFDNVDWKPLMYQGPCVWDFIWNDIKCSITGNDNYICIRVHDLTPGVGEIIMEQLKQELLNKWKDPIPKDNLIVFTAVRTLAGYVWTQANVRRPRHMETIYISSEIKKSLINKLSKFYESETVYDKYCVTWKRVHLFYGPPGTGKTSTVLALASIFKKHIAKITIVPTMNGSDVELLIRNLRDDTFLLMEDVDSLFAGRKSDTNLDFSSIINCLDGVATKRGLVVFMTTNHISQLDPALMRPGRVDDCVEFELPDDNVLRDALKMLGEKYSHEHDTFIEKFGKEISIAGLQKHLFECIMSDSDTMLNYIA